MTCYAAVENHNRVLALIFNLKGTRSEISSLENSGTVYLFIWRVRIPSHLITYREISQEVMERLLRPNLEIENKINLMAYIF